jgi:hypothetical protein
MISEGGCVVNEGPRCRWCGKAIAKRTQLYWVREEPGVLGPQKDHIYTGKGKRLHSKEECKPYTNQVVTSVKYTEDREGYDGPVIDRYVWAFSTWDGESYVDRFFCNSEHAKQMGYAAAEKGWSTKAWRKVTTEEDMS